MQIENSSSLGPPWDPCNRLGLLRNLVSWTEQLPDPWPFFQEKPLLDQLDHSL